jgi:AICAR transformylase/IMP cyclohydrolase PurH
MKEFELKYGCNPNQKPSKIFMHDGSELPIEILNGRPGYINFLDAFNSWQLVRSLRRLSVSPQLPPSSTSAPPARRLVFLFPKS